MAKKKTASVRGTGKGKEVAHKLSGQSSPSRASRASKSRTHRSKSSSSTPSTTKRKVEAARSATSKQAPSASRQSVDIEEFRDLLLTWRARVRGDVEQMTTEALDRNGDGSESKSPTHLAELGTETYEQDFALRRVENERELLDEIDAALARIANGTYGLCIACLEAGVSPAKAQIPKARLRAIPYARNCIECERKREKASR